MARILYVTIAGAGAKNGLAWSTAFGEAEFEADLEGAAHEDGDTYYVMSGAADGGTPYTLDSSYDAAANDGTATLPVSIIGVKFGTNHDDSVPVLADWGSGLDRPVFACGASYYVGLGDYYKIFNCVFTGASTTLLNMGAQNVAYNCKATNSRAATATATAFSGTSSTCISCEGIGGDSTHGYAFYVPRMIFCYAHDCNWGVDTVAGGTYLFNIFDTATIGISVASDDVLTIFGNTIYNCVTSISATDSYSTHSINNIIDTSTDAFVWTTQTDINMYMYNHRGNSVTDMYDTANNKISSTIPHTDNWVTGGAGEDPDFTNEADGDFSLEATSPCIDAGMAMVLGVG